MDENHELVTSVLDLIKNAETDTLLIAGEGFPMDLLKGNTIETDLLTNRVDIHREMKGQNIHSSLSDFEITKNYGIILFFLFKEKAINHYVINQSFDSLTDQGRMFLIGNKNEGIKTYTKKAEQLYNHSAEIKLFNKGNRIISLIKNNPKGTLLDDLNYPDLRKDCIKSLPSVYSKPGVFGWNKVDAGSEFLINNIDFIEGSTILDLGCGYGYLSMKAHEKKSCTIVATDNNIAALNACRKNFQHFNITGSVILDDCGSDINQKFDIILCNPPFHEGFKTSRYITTKFVMSIKTHLAPGGNAYMVVNAFIKIEEVLEQHNMHFSEILRNNKFKIINVKK